MKHALLVTMTLLAATAALAEPKQGTGSFKSGLVAHYFADPEEWNGKWPNESDKPNDDPGNWTFTSYKYSRVEPVINHLFIKKGWFSVRWTGWLDPTNPGKDNDGQIDFDIDGGRMVPTKSFKAQVTILGVALESGGKLLPVTVKVEVGDKTYQPWGMFDRPDKANVNDGKNPRTYKIASTFPAGYPVSITAASWATAYAGRTRNQSSWNPLLQVGPGSNSANLRVLRDGDHIDDLPGFGGQSPIVSFVKPFVTGGKVKLEPGQALFLYELGTTNMYAQTADYQDLAVLVTISDAEGPSAVTGKKNEGDEATGEADYFFEILADDGCRLIIDGKTLINDWQARWEKDPLALRKAKGVRLNDGKHQIVVEYFQGQSLKQDDHDPIKLYWSCPARKVTRQLIPASHFSHGEEHLGSYERP